MTTLKCFAVSILLLLLSCSDLKKQSTQPLIESALLPSHDSVVYSFAFMGCNRIDRHDSSNASKANVLVLKSILNDVQSLNKKPALFFMLGDIVLGESSTSELDNQLNAWQKQYRDPNFSSFSTSGIEMVAVPGNHEMLYYNNKNKGEWPLKGATDIWLKHMATYMPANRVKVAGPDSIDNQMTFSFTRNNIGFVVMNTDTYNAPTHTNKDGLEGMLPTQWVIDQVNALKANASIKHIFVLGHKPYYVGGYPTTSHEGLPSGPILWPAFNQAGVVAMLSAHVHDYERWQKPADTGTYQIIAGNGGSNGAASFFGYTLINILKSGKVQLISRGFPVQNPYYRIPNPLHFTTWDSTILTWTKNANPYN